jgi:hypothetical protein
MLKDVHSTNIEDSIRTLAAFGTRHTLSSQTDPNRGIAPRRRGSTTSSSSTQLLRTAG